MEKARGILRKQAIKISLGGTIAVAILLILGPVMNIIFVNDPSISISISVAILTAVGVILLDYLSEVKRLIRPPEINFHYNQDEADQHLRTYIESVKPSEADLLMVSSHWIFGNIILPLVKEQSSIRLLLYDPHKAEEQFNPSRRQQRRICSAIVERLSAEPETARYDKIRVRFYRETPSLRGIRLGNRIVHVGWYTWDLRPDKTDTNTEPVQIWGHNNASLSIAASEKDFEVVYRLFNKVFTNLWLRAELPKDVCNGCDEKTNNKCPISSAWLDLASRD